MVAVSPLTLPDWCKALPVVQGGYSFHEPLAPLTWFRVGGQADCFFRPRDADDLLTFWQHKPVDVPVTILGVGSNLLVRDGGIRGIVIRLGKSFQSIESEGDYCLRVGAAALDIAVSRIAAEASITGLEFLRGIPGTIGGALAMNAGSYGSEMKDILIEAYALDLETGEPIIIKPESMGFTYRHTEMASRVLFTGALLKGSLGKKETILQVMDQITQKREETQPVRSRTGGSTFKNPTALHNESHDGLKAWQLIDQAGCRGFSIGGAQMSPLHCNFMINTGDATAMDLEMLGETVRQRVLDTSGVCLEWEIKRLGEPVVACDNISNDRDNQCL